MNVPKDPVMLLSFINLKLRDYYSNLGDLCSSLDLDETELKSRLHSINYSYDSTLNRFI